MTGAGATFDWTFFDNSKLINFDYKVSFLRKKIHAEHHKTQSRIRLKFVAGNEMVFLTCVLFSSVCKWKIMKLFDPSIGSLVVQKHFSFSSYLPMVITA